MIMIIMMDEENIDKKQIEQLEMEEKTYVTAEKIRFSFFSNSIWLRTSINVCF